MIQIHLPQELDAFVQQQLQAGQYASMEEVIHDALRLLMDQATLRMVKLAKLRRQIAVGLEQSERGESTPFDMQALQVEAARMLLQDQEQGTEACPR